jgi:hypothetical protein
MDRVIAALKRSGIADRDIQTSAISLSPRWNNPEAEAQRIARETRQPYVPTNEAPRIIGYVARNNVQVRARCLGEMGKIIDTLVGSGANEVNGPSFTLDDQKAALDEARTEAVATGRQPVDAVRDRPLGVEVGDFGIRRQRLPQQGARLLGRQIQHHGALGHGRRCFQLPGIDALELGLAPRPCRLAPGGGRAERAQMDIVDVSFRERVLERRLGEARPPRVGDRTNVDEALNAGLAQGGKELAHRRALVANGEDAHAYIVTPDLIRGLPFPLSMKKRQMPGQARHDE